MELLYSLQITVLTVSESQILEEIGLFACKIFHRVAHYYVLSNLKN
jgi:hypothetical protein